jgi:hypothetical protein
MEAEDDKLANHSFFVSHTQLVAATLIFTFQDL